MQVKYDIVVAIHYFPHWNYLSLNSFNGKTALHRPVEFNQGSAPKLLWTGQWNWPPAEQSLGIESATNAIYR